MVDVRGDVLRPPHCTTSAAVKANNKIKIVPLRAMKTFIRKMMGHSLMSDPVLTRQPKRQRKQVEILDISSKSNEICTYTFLLHSVYSHFRIHDTERLLCFVDTNRETDEPRHDKTNKVTVCPAKTQISLVIRPVWLDFTVRSIGS